MLRARWPLLALLALHTVGPAWAEAPASPEPPAEKWRFDRSLTVSPAPAVVPALKYRLFPSVVERREGNAVPIYLRPLSDWSEEWRRRLIDLPAKWNKLPLAEVPLDEARAFLTEKRHLLRQLELGARRRIADWNYTLDQGREYGGPLGVPVGDLEVTRIYSRLLTLQARTQIREGDFPAAVHTLETGFSMSQQVAEGGFLINALVGVAGASTMLDPVTDLMERPEAPNLYWALATLPRPLIDLRRTLELEDQMPFLMFPDLADLDRARPAAEWDTVLAKLRRELLQLAEQSKEGKPPPADGPDDQARALSAARNYLVERLGLSKEAAEAMPASLALLHHIRSTYRDHGDEIHKAAYLPAPDARSVRRAAIQRLTKAPLVEGTVLARAFQTGIGSAFLAGERLERRLTLLRVIEALRMHAAAHDGQFPDTLADVTVVPVPNDPGTGKPFEYARDGTTATLIGRLPDEPGEGIRYQITLRKQAGP